MPILNGNTFKSRTRRRRIRKSRKRTKEYAEERASSASVLCRAQLDHATRRVHSCGRVKAWQAHMMSPTQTCARGWQTENSSLRAYTRKIQVQPEVGYWHRVFKYLSSLGVTIIKTSDPYGYEKQETSLGFHRSEISGS
eukprot:1185813-Prorocentrum_minimum.AAC.3